MFRLPTRGESLLNSVVCEPKMGSMWHACSSAHVSTCPECLHAHVPCVLTCFTCFIVPWVLTCLTCHHALRTYVLTCQSAFRAHVTMFQHALSSLPHKATHLAYLLSSFNATVFRFFVIVVEAVHIACKVWQFN